MKEVKVFKRKVLVRTGYKKYPYSEHVQITITYGGNEFASNHIESIDNKRLRIPFKECLKTRSIKEIKKISEMKGCRSSEDKFMKEKFQLLLKKIENENK